MSDIVTLNNMVPALPEQFEEMTKLLGGTFLPRIQLMAIGSGPVQEKKIEAGNYALIVDQNLIDLTNTFNALPLTPRAKAMKIDKASGTVEAVWDQASAEFIAIQTEADNKPGSGCMFGVEFLMFVPEFGFVTYFAASASARKSAGKIIQFIQQKSSATFGSRLIQKNHTWWAPTFEVCQEPLESVPNVAEVQEKVEWYLGLGDTTVEDASIKDTDTTRD